MMPAFSRGDRRNRAPKIIGVIVADRRDDRRGRIVDDVGGVETAAEPDLEQQHVGGALGEQHEGGCGRDLEHRDRPAGIGILAAAERFDQPLLVDEAPAADLSEPDALVESHEMRRGVDMCGEARAFQDRAHEGDGRSLAVGAGHVDHRRQAPFRMPERGEEVGDALEREIDRARVQRQEAGDQRVGRIHAAAEIIRRRWRARSAPAAPPAPLRALAASSGRATDARSSP